MTRAENKADRLLQIEALLLAHPEGLTQAEIARRLDVNRSTVNRYFRDMPNQFPYYESDDGRLFIDRQSYLVNVRFGLHEALAVHLASRLLATRMDRQNPHAASALRKLGLALERLAPRISRHVQQSADVMDEAAQRHDPVYLQALEKLTQAWAEQRKAQVWHRSEKTGKVFEYLFSPYFIEPYAVGQTTMLIGHSQPPGKIRTLKIERIERVELTHETYEIPADFDPRDLLADAWGIWYTESEPVEVVLKFHPRVARRVLETRWHRSEQERELPDGSIEWRAKVAEVQEMIPWIRGWGADCEVLVPKGLREKLIEETRQMATMYKVGNMPTVPAYQLLWAKTDDTKAHTHPLICHMIDVAQVALALWKYVLAESIRKQISTTISLNDDEAGRIIAFWAGLHDLGKASPSFQRQYSPAVAMLTNAGLDFSIQVGQSDCRHDVITSHSLTDLLVSETDLPKEWANQVAITVGGHHGAWATSQDLDKYAAPSQVGGKNWDCVRQELVQCLKEKLQVPNISITLLSPEEANSFFILLAGLTSTADWIGSQQQYFEPVNTGIDLDDYFKRAGHKALDALKETGWIGWQPPSTLVSFEILCNVKQLRPLQEASVALADKLDQPALVIIEAPTGVGKTEAALYLADHWARVLQQRGMYVAMPTMATSNQMFGRVRQVLERRYPAELVNYQLLHGNALLMNDEQVPRLTKVDKEDDRNIVAALEWFTKRKRGLLAPFGVGTVDQTLMSILQTRHFFVRLFGLSHKTVIFDEVHAYDTYMDELFFLLLRWLRTVGASVVILSATLSNASRRRILEAYISHDLKETQAITYPAITWTIGNAVEVIPLKAETRTVAVELIERDTGKIARRLAEELQDGGCAVIICNTVRRAKEIYLALEAAKIVPEEDLIVFHARFPWEWREEIERDVLARFGKSENDEPHSRKKSIVVATQVIEQSLDLDFDLMISDLAPMDLIIQRIGRLHRHSENDAQRPARLKEKRVLIALPHVENDVPKFERGETWVYEKYFLMRSWAVLQHVLQQKRSITTPDETQDLIEAIYGNESLLPSELSETFRQALRDAKEKMENTDRDAQRQARSKLISLPDDRFMLEESNAGLEEDNPALHQYRQAATRLAPPSITLICLYQTSQGLTLSLNADSPVIDWMQEPDRDMTCVLLNRKVEVADYRVVKYFANQDPPTGWRKNPWLRFARVIDFSEGGDYFPKDEKWKLILNRKLGLTVEEL